MALVTSNFSGISDVTEVVSAAAQTEINAQVQKILDTVLKKQTPPDSHVIPGPYFDPIPEPAREVLVNELTALQAAIDAAPTA